MLASVLVPSVPDLCLGGWSHDEHWKNKLARHAVHQRVVDELSYTVYPTFGNYTQSCFSRFTEPSSLLRDLLSCFSVWLSILNCDISDIYPIYYTIRYWH